MSTAISTPTISKTTSSSTRESNASVFLGVELCSEKVLIPIDSIIAIIPTGNYNPIPLTKNWVLGIANWQGKFVTAIDVSELFGGQEQCSNTQNQMLVVESENFTYGLLFQTIYDKYHLGHHLWQDFIHPACKGVVRGYVARHVLIDQKPWHALDLPSLFESPKLYNLQLG